jgi:hypothetical protein
MTDTDLDTLLQRELLQPPPDFAQRVLRQLPRQTMPLAPPKQYKQPTPWSRLRWLLAATGLLGGGVLGLSQAGGFVFGLWLGAAAL